MQYSVEVREFAKRHKCSLSEASKIVGRRKFCEELRSDRSVVDLADTLIRILNFEFGGYRD